MRMAALDATNRDFRLQMAALDATNRELRADIDHLKSIVRQQHTRITFLESNQQLCDDEIQHLHSEIQSQAGLRVLELEQVRREHDISEIRARRERLKRKAAELGVDEPLQYPQAPPGYLARALGPPDRVLADDNVPVQANAAGFAASVSSPAHAGIGAAIGDASAAVSASNLSSSSSSLSLSS